MRDWPAGLRTSLAAQQVTRCFLVEMINRRGDVVRATDYDASLAIGSSLFLHDPGFHVTNVRLQAGGEPPQVDLQLPISDEGPIFADHVRRGVWRGGEIRLWVADYTDPENKIGLLVDGFVGNVQFTDETVSDVEILTRGDKVRDLILPRIQPRCRHTFGDSYCMFPLFSVTVDAEVDSVVSNSKFVVDLTNPDALDFTAGALKFTSGNNVGISAEVRKWTSGSMTLETWDSLPLDVQVGDTMQVHAGCARTRAACDEYDNLVHFGGYDKVPGSGYGD